MPRCIALMMMEAANRGKMGRAELNYAAKAWLPPDPQRESLTDLTQARVFQVVDLRNFS